MSYVLNGLLGLTSFIGSLVLLFIIFVELDELYLHIKFKLHKRKRKKGAETC